MADVTFSTNWQSPDIKGGTTGSANVVTRVVVPAYAKMMTIRFDTNAGKVATLQTLTDAAALDTAPYMPVSADSDWGVVVEGLKYIFVTSATGSTVFHVMVEG